MRGTPDARRQIPRERPDGRLTRPSRTLPSPRRGGLLKVGRRFESCSGRLRTFCVLAAAAALAVPAAAQAAFPGGNGKLAFFQNDIGAVAPFGIAIANADGSGQELIGPTCQEGEPRPCPGNPTWSADGRRIAFDVGGDIATIRPDGKQLRVIDVPGVRASRPAWSPDGQTIVFQGRKDGIPNLFTIGRTGSGLRQLTFRRGGEPTWSSDDRIAFRRKGDVYLIRADGTGLDRRTFKGGTQPNWSPFARRVAFVRKGNLHVIRSEGSKPRKLTGKGGTEPAWTPDGKRILFVRNFADGAQILIYGIRPDGGGLKLVTGGEQGRRLAVSDPDQQPL
jgi:Tol biopolymer transport system component